MTLIFCFYCRQLERNTIESLKSFCLFDHTVLLIMKNRIEVFHVSLAQQRPWTWPCLVMFMEETCISVSVLINLQIKVSVVSSSVEFGEKGGGKLPLSRIRKNHLRCILTEATKKLLSWRLLSIICIDPLLHYGYLDVSLFSEDYYSLLHS